MTTLLRFCARCVALFISRSLVLAICNASKFQFLNQDTSTACCHVHHLPL